MKNNKQDGQPMTEEAPVEHSYVALREEAEHRYRVLSEATFEALFITKDGIVINCNDQAVELLGYDTIDRIIGHSVEEFAAPSSRALVREMSTKNRSGRYEAEIVSRSGRTVSVEVHGRRIHYRGESVRVAALRDITERKRAEARVQFQARILEEVRDVVIAFDLSLRITYWNTSAENLMGVDEERAMGRRLHEVVNFQWIAPDSERTMRRGLQKDGSWRGELIVIQPDGAERYVSVSSSLYYDEHDRAAGVLSVMHDVTERRQREAQFIQRAYHDSLTGLPNRKLFLFRTWSAITSYTLEEGEHYAALFLDLDRFKIVNDSLGHEAGDELLRMLADRVRRLLRTRDTIGRLGGDEFGILMEGIRGVEDAKRVAERLIEDLKEPFDLQGRDLVVTASIGIVIGGERHESPKDVLRDADTAMYHAKNGGGDRYAVFESSMGEAVSARFRMETDLRRALVREELEVYYQPIVLLEDGTLTGVEALVRWQHPDRGLLTPGVFLPVAEEAGLMIHIDRWLMREACAQMSRWSRRGQTTLTLNVNCSDQMFRQADLVGFVGEVLAETGLSADQLALEITERVFIEEPDHAVSKLEQLKTQQQLEICMDDFGTGYSSLGLLHKLPIDVLKIDRAFIKQLPDDEKGRGMAQAIVDLADNLRLPVVAEGIETEEQLEVVSALGCRYGQGYLFQRPVPANEAAEVMREVPWEDFALSP